MKVPFGADTRPIANVITSCGAHELIDTGLSDPRSRDGDFVVFFDARDFLMRSRVLCRVSYRVERASVTTGQAYLPQVSNSF